MFRPSYLHFAASLALGLVLGCGCGHDAPSPTTAAPLDPPVAPESLVFEVRLVGGSATLVAIAEHARHPLFSAIMPRNTRDLLGRLAPVPSDVLTHVRADADLAVIFLRSDAGLRAVFAVRAELAPEPTPLGPDVTVRAGAPAGARWVGDPPGANGGAAVALANDVLFWADDQASLEAGARYARSLLEAPNEVAALHLRVPDGVVARRTRPFLERTVQSLVGSARLSLAEERRRRGREADLGDPVALLNAVERSGIEIASLLSDLREVRGVVHGDGNGVHLAIDANVQPGSPFAQRLAGAKQVTRQTIEQLPSSTSIAWIIAIDEPALWLQPLGLQPPALERGVAALRTLGAGEHPLTWVIGSYEASPYIGIRGQGRRAQESEAALTALLNLEPVPALLGRLAGCPDPTTTLRWRGQGPLREARPCGLDGRSVFTHFAGPRWAMSVGTLPEAFRQGTAQSTLASSADAKRAIDGLAERLLAAIVIDPEAALATLGAIAGRVSFGPSMPRPSVVGLTHGNGALSLRMELPPGGLDAWARMGWTLRGSLQEQQQAAAEAAPAAPAAQQ